MELTLTVPDELATRLRRVEDRLPEIIEIGLREWLSTSPGYTGLADVLETLARLPSPEEVLGLRPSHHISRTASRSCSRKTAPGDSRAEEQREWERYEYIEHLVRVAKGRAIQRQALR